METNKIFGIGLSKTGTTTLFAALHILGYRSGTFRHLRKKSLTQWFRGDFSHDYIADFDAVTDLPIGAFYPALDARYPRSKFILTTRSKADWLASCRKFFSHEKMELNKHRPFRNLTQVAAYGVVSFDEELFSYAYDRHEYSVRKYFHNRPSDLLTISITEGDGWEPLCSFLQKPVPDIEFPKILPGDFLLPEELISWKDRNQPILRLKRFIRNHLLPKKIL